MDKSVFKILFFITIIITIYHAYIMVTTLFLLIKGINIRIYCLSNEYVIYFYTFIILMDIIILIELLKVYNKRDISKKKILLLIIPSIPTINLPVVVTIIYYLIRQRRLIKNNNGAGGGI